MPIQTTGFRYWILSLVCTFLVAIITLVTGLELKQHPDLLALHLMWGILTLLWTTITILTFLGRKRGS